MASARTEGQLKAHIAREIGEAALAQAKPEVARASNQLASALRLVIERPAGAKGNVVARVRIPHYWAIYVHDGRGPFRKERFMVWWKNPKRDPRLKDGLSPVRASQVRRLTRAQWLQALQEREDWISSGGDPYDAPVIITKAVRRATKPRPFFSNGPGGGMQGFVNQANKIGRDIFSAHVRELLGEDFRKSQSCRGNVFF